MTEIIENVGETLYDLPIGTTLRGVAGTGDGGATAVRTATGWDFTDRHGSHFTPGRLLGARYEVVSRPTGNPGPAIGDIIPNEQVDDLPLGSLILYYGGRGGGVVHDHYVLVAKVGADEYRWLTRGMLDDGDPYRTESRIYVGMWKVLHLGAVPARHEPARVGDTVGTKRAAAALPAGAVIVDERPDSDPAATHPAIKIGDNEWMFHAAGGAVFDGDALFDGNPHRVIHLPEEAS